jgi:hypothetical protein
VVTFPDFLLALQGPALNVAVGLALSFAAGYVPWFLALSPKSKRLATGLLSLVIPMLAWLVASLAGFQAWGSWWPAAVSGATAFAAATGLHTRWLSADKPV